MATSDFWQRVLTPVASPAESLNEARGRPSRHSDGTSRLWILSDIVTIILSSVVATTFEFHTGIVTGAKEFYRGTLIHGRSMGLLLGILCVFTFALVVTSRRMRLYNPASVTNFLHEQRLSVQACLTSGLLLTGTLYLVHAADIPRSVVLITLCLVTLALSLRRLVYRILLHRKFERGIDTRNVLIVGSGPEAHALRNHLDSIRHLGYIFKGFIDLPSKNERMDSTRSDVVGTIDTLFQQARKRFVDEIIFTSPCERDVVQAVLGKARLQGVDLRLVPELYGGLAWNSPVEYIGQFPTIPLHCGHVPEIRLLLKRLLDIVTCSLGLILLSPALVVIAIAIKLDSKGPVFYASERIGKKGRVFRCLKFRTMVRDAEQRRAEMMHLNERDEVLFKVSNDPRITKVGRWLRKYSLDELPQFFNVLCGDMSVVGPRPPIASEVQEYKLNHLRRLDVVPGITGLWQVQARQDPSFDSYVSLDMNYVENWSIWLDIKIMVRTIGVVFSGTGS